MVAPHHGRGQMRAYLAADSELKAGGHPKWRVGTTGGGASQALGFGRRLPGPGPNWQLLLLGLGGLRGAGGLVDLLSLSLFFSRKH